MDALVALMLVLILVLVAYPLFTSERHESALPRDTIKVLSTLKIGEVDAPEIPGLIASGVITNPNESVIRQLGELAITNLTAAKSIAATVLQSIDTNDNIGIWYDNTLLASKNTTAYSNASYVDTARQIISGISGNGTNQTVTGFSAQAFLASSLRSEYFYFGGYVGDGDVISTRVDFMGNISSARIEGVFRSNSGSFEVFVNGVNAGSFDESVNDFTPVMYNLSTADFVSGTNIVEFHGDNMHIAGGFVRVIHASDIQFDQPDTYYFPGIEGLINVYDSFFVPGELTSLNISLHLNSTDLGAFLNIGNVTVYNGTTSGEQTITLDNAELSSMLDYSQLTNQTIPLRLSLENVSFVQNVSLDADTVSVTDISGSMSGGSGCSTALSFCCYVENGAGPFSDFYCNTEPVCTTCGATWSNNTKLDLAKQANRDLMDALLGDPGNQVSLVGYSTTADVDDYHELSTNIVTLNQTVTDWTAGGETCICCGINRAIQELTDSSSEEKYRSLIVMSDGAATTSCVEQGVTGDLDGNGVSDTAADDAIQAACDAFAEGIIVYSVGFDIGVGSDEANVMTQIATACGQGTYYSAGVDDLLDIYAEITQDIIDASFYEQTLVSNGSLFTQLYPDSYIQFEYTKPSNPFGLILTAEKTFDTSSIGTFDLPLNATPLQANVISYSGTRWTNRLEVNGEVIYDLDEYGTNYIPLGDPYSLYVGPEYIQDSNEVNLTTGLGGGDSFGGSVHNKIIYTILKSASAFSPILSLSQGCTWTIDFESGSMITTSIPSTYTGSDTCLFNAANPLGFIQNDEDALQISVRNLLRELDFDNDGLIDVAFDEQDLQIDLEQITGIPFTWSTEVQVRVWV